MIRDIRNLFIGLLSFYFSKDWAIWGKALKVGKWAQVPLVPIQKG